MPPDPFAVLTETPLADACDTVPGVDEPAAGAPPAVLVLALELLPHPATINATPISAATPPERTFTVVQLAMCVAPSPWFHCTRHFKLPARGSLDRSLQRVIS
jgi:hypothetical protein